MGKEAQKLPIAIAKEKEMELRPISTPPARTNIGADVGRLYSGIYYLDDGEDMQGVDGEGEGGREGRSTIPNPHPPPIPNIPSIYQEEKHVDLDRSGVRVGSFHISMYLAGLVV